MSPISDPWQQRFSGIARLYGEPALARLARAHFVVVGLGGVGSWTAEALTRSGVGELTLIELDEVCVSNTNRQLHALTSRVGQSKNRVVGERLLDINPELRLHCVEDFLTRTNTTDLIGRQHHVVIDATDAAHIKASLAAYCSAIKVRLVTVGSSGGKRDPRQIQVDDLGRTSADPLLGKVRELLYRHHRFSRDKQRKFRIDAIYSAEQMVYPKPNGEVCQSKQTFSSGVKLDCSGGFGSSVMVTGSFGFMAATRAVERYLEKEESF